MHLKQILKNAVAILDNKQIYAIIKIYTYYKYLHNIHCKEVTGT